MSVVGSDDGELPSPLALSNSEEVAQIMSESNNNDNFRPASNLELIFKSAARLNEMAPGGAMARPNQPGNEQVAIRRFGTS
eukprot:5251126-Prymnesium_polylepis.1